MPLPENSAASALWSAAGIAILLVVCGYIGFLFKNKTTTFENYLVGERNLGPIITGAAVAAGYLSGWAALGMMGVTYTVGWSGMWFAGIWTIFGIVPCVLFVARKFSDFSRRFQAQTVADVLGIRFDSKAVQVTAGIVMVILMFIYSIGQLKAAATCWYAITGFSPFICLLLSIIVVVVYMLIGGYTGTQWAMGIQGFLIGAACLALGIWAIYLVGGPAGLSKMLAAQDVKLLALMRPDLPQVGNTQLFSSMVGITSTFFLFFTMATGFPHVTARFLGMRALTKKDYINLMLTVFLIAGIPIFLNAVTGLSARAIWGAQLMEINPWKADLAAPFMAMSGGLPLTVLYITGLFSAALSSLAGMILSIAGGITRDVIQILKPDTSPRFLLLLTRILIVVVIFIPFYWTLVSPPPLLAAWMAQAAIGMGGIFIWVIAGSLYWKRATATGAIICMLYGIIAVLIGSVLVSQNSLGMGTLMYIVLIGCGICYVGGSLLTSPPPQEKVRQFFTAHVDN